MDYKKIELEKLNHLLNIGKTIDEIESLFDVEIEELMMTPEDTYEELTDSEEMFNREAIMSK